MKELEPSDCYPGSDGPLSGSYFPSLINERLWNVGESERVFQVERISLVISYSIVNENGKYFWQWAWAGEDYIDRSSKRFSTELEAFQALCAFHDFQVVNRGNRKLHEYREKCGAFSDGDSE